MATPESRFLWRHPLLHIEERTLPSGEKRLIVHRGAFAAISIALYTDEGEEAFLIVSQERPVAPGPFYEHPAGMIDPDESPIQAALRELAEETGWLLSAEDLIPLTPKGLYPSPAFWGEVGYFYTTRLKVPSAILRAYQSKPYRTTSGENITLHVMPGDRILSITRNLQTIAHTLLHYVHFGTSDGKLPPLSAE
ncbi:MAG: NUDIX hydrolase [Bacteroidia bacterium]|nr:NUDIX hydrolase [Bacteroidia bacterium]MCX7652573.1 NUDIX hydrolase [Bacteroidia bacterium]MDW8417163.1 NUDIX hydrolase [Bacteroidia bacterium]